jgi:hypothetical protein
MNEYTVVGYAIQLAIALGVTLGVYALLRSSLGELLSEVVKLPAATVFYLRSLLLLLLLTALGQTVGDKLEVEAGAAFMEYVWQVAQTTGEVCQNFVWVFLLYLIQVTILTAVLKRRHE